MDYQTPPQTYNGSGFGIASMVLGIVALVSWCIPGISILCSIIGIILGGVGHSGDRTGKGMATAGIVCSIITLIIWIIIFILSLIMASGLDLFS